MSVTATRLPHSVAVRMAILTASLLPGRGDGAGRDGISDLQQEE